MNWYIIFFFCLAVALYLYTRYIRLQCESQQEKIEEFQTFENMTPVEKLQDNHGIRIIFLSASDAARQMKLHAGEYINRMNQPNLAARGVQTRDELLAAYSNAFLDIIPIEQYRVIEFTLGLLSQVQYKYPAYYRYLIKWLGNISIAKAKASLEGGMPHTLDNIVVMDVEWFSKPRSTTLLHEITHIHQRQVPFEFEDLYSELGYLATPVSDIRGMEAVLQLNRNNPDGMSPDWLWLEKADNTCAKFWWIGAVFSSIVPAGLGDVSLIAVNIIRDSDGKFYYLKQQPMPLNTHRQFLKYFGGSSPNNYHPNEMTAKFAEWYLEDMLGMPNRNNNMQPGYQVYKNYFNKLLEKYY